MPVPRRIGYQLMPAARSTSCSPVLSARQLSDHLAVDRHTVTDKWLPAGCPVETRADAATGKAWSFRLADVVRWLVERGPGDQPDGAGAADYGLERARKERGLADIAELKAAAMRGRLIEIAEVTAIVADEYARVRARLLSMPAALAMRVQHETDLQSLERTVKAAVSEALAELAADQRSDWADKAADAAMAHLDTSPEE